MSGEPRTLAALRQQVPLHDLNTEALRLPPRNTVRKPYCALAQCNKRPTDLAELHAVCQPYGDAAIKQAVWGGISLWMLKTTLNNYLSVPYVVAQTAIILCRDADRRAGYPDLTGIPSSINLSLLSVSSQEEAWRVAAIVRDDWVSFNQPWLDNSIDHTFQYIRAYKRMISEQTPRTSN